MVLPLWVVENRSSPLLWPLAYTTACTTVQAVMMLSVLNTDPIFSVSNATGVPNVPTVPNMPKMTMNDPIVPKAILDVPTKTLSVPTAVLNVKCPPYFLFVKFRTFCTFQKP